MKRVLFIFIYALSFANFVEGNERDLVKKEEAWLKNEIKVVAKELWSVYVTSERDKNKMDELLGLLTQMEILLTSRTENCKSVYFSNFSELNLPSGAVPMNILAYELYSDSKIKIDLRTLFKPILEEVEE